VKVPFNPPPVNVPPVMTLPESVIAAGSERVGLPARQFPFVTVISFAVPVIVRAVQAVDAECPAQPTPIASSAVRLVVMG
jgi:hypothetical protein